MEHMGIDSGTTNIFDDVDRNDFKTDFGSEFPVGLIVFSTHYSFPCLLPVVCTRNMFCFILNLSNLIF